MNQNFSGMNGENSIYRPIDTANIRGMNNRTYIYSSVNNINLSGMNQIVYANFQNSRINNISIAGMNNIIYLNDNSRNYVQRLNGLNNRIIFTGVQRDNNPNNQYNYRNNNFSQMNL